MILVVAEKESVAGEISKITGSTNKKNGYLEGNGYLVTWCIGHLVSLASPEKYGVSGPWSVDQLPILPSPFQFEVLPSKKKQYGIVQELMNRPDVTELVEATDAGREGELIFRLVYQQAGCQKPFKRLWISSLEEKSIRDGLANAKPSEEYNNLYQAALSRQRADWLVGINLTRFYTSIYHKKLTCGRVQTPTLAMVVQRERDIKDFIPKPYFVLTANCGAFKATKRVETAAESESILAKCHNADATVVSVKKEDKKNSPTALYDLTSLQREASRMLGYSAQQTLDYLQALYDKKLATYPRTDSRYLTEDMEESTKELIVHLLNSGLFPALLKDQYQLDNVNVKQVINNAKVSDHHAVLPTANVTTEAFLSLPTGEKNILLLVMYRLLSATYTPYIYASTKITLDIAGEEFSANSNVTLSPGYRIVDGVLRAEIKASEDTGDKEDDAIAISSLPEIAEGSILQLQGLNSTEKATKPPKSFDDDSLLEAMENAGKSLDDPALRDMMKANHGLGTTATRASIIEGLLKTGYLERKGKKYIPTDMAYAFIDLCDPTIKDPAMTAEWEMQLDYINQGALTSDAFLQEIIRFVSEFITEQKATLTGQDLSATFRTERPSIGICPKCGKAVREYPKSWSCESGKEGCGFTIWKTIASKKLTVTQATKLLENGKTGIIKGFKSKTGKSFDASLFLQDDFTVGFSFEKPKK